LGTKVDHPVPMPSAPLTRTMGKMGTYLTGWGGIGVGVGVGLGGVRGWGFWWGWGFGGKGRLGASGLPSQPPPPGRLHALPLPNPP
jgi:hypothetical protein